MKAMFAVAATTAGRCGERIGVTDWLSWSQKKEKGQLSGMMGLHFSTYSGRIRIYTFRYIRSVQRLVFVFLL